LLKVDSIERIAGLAGGCVWLAFSGGVEAGVVGAVAAAGLAAATIDLTRKDGPESKAALKKIIRSVRRDFDAWADSERLDLSGQLLAAETALAEELNGCILDRRALAQSALDPDGFPASATRLVIAALAERAPIFREDAGSPLGREFAETVIASALRAAVEERAYFERLQPHLMFEALRGLGVLQRDMKSLVSTSDATRLMVTQMFNALNVAGSLERAGALGLSNRQVLNLLQAFALEHVAIADAEAKLLGAARRLRELEALHERTRYEEGDNGEAVRSSAENALADADIPTATALIVSEFVRDRIEDGDRRYDPKLRHLFGGTRSKSSRRVRPDTRLSWLPNAAHFANLFRRSKPKLIGGTAAKTASEPDEKQTNPINEALAIDEIRIELGYALLVLINDLEGRRLADQIQALRHALAQEFGFVMPPVRLLDSIKLPNRGYVIRIKEMEAGSGEVRLGSVMAMDPTGRQVELPGEHTMEPAFGLPATWIDESLREEAERSGYTVVDPATVLTTHLTEILKENMSELLSYSELVQLLETMNPHQRELLNELVPGTLTLVTVQRVLQGLLDEKVSIRDLGRITEALAESAAHIPTVTGLVEHVRSRLSRQLCFQHRHDDGALHVVTLSSAWEQAFSDALVADGEDKQLNMPAAKLQEFIREVRRAFEQAAISGISAVLLTSPAVRPYARSIVRRFRGQTVVLSHNEIHPRARLNSIDSI